MNWAEEISNSLRWIAIAFVISSFAFVVMAFLLRRFTLWGADVARLCGDHFNPKRSKTPLILLALVILLAMASVRINVIFSYWNRDLYNSMQNLDVKAFWAAILLFLLLLTLILARALISYYVRQKLLIEWRQSLTNKLMDSWLTRKAYYRSAYCTKQIDNPDQRIQQDVDYFVSLSLSLSVGLIQSLVSLFEFTILLWSLSATLALFGIEIPRAMVFLAYGYVLIATVFAIKLGRPLINLNFLNEKLNADFRYSLIRLKEYGESIAFFSGEKSEKKNLAKRFSGVIENSWALVFRSLKFDGYNITISQFANIFPYLVQAPRLFAKEIQLGDVMQTRQAFGEVEEALSFIRSSYDSFATYRAVTTRLIGFLNIIEEAQELPEISKQHAGQHLRVENLVVKSMDGNALFNTVNIDLAPGEALLVSGPSGVGKTTLLRSLAGLWPYADGQVTYPEESTHFFLPQKPYMPLGSLRNALHYPNAPELSEHDAHLLTQVHLGHLISKLDDEDDWTRVLSLGEQQRLAIARALLVKPQVLFLDEASSAMDEGLEFSMYQLIKEHLPNAIIISIGHRSSLQQFHTQKLELLPLDLAKQEK
jgi:putative ATP-binding cassette transporter